MPESCTAGFVIACLVLGMAGGAQAGKAAERSRKPPKFKVGQEVNITFDLSGELYYVEPNIPRLPADFSSLKPVGVLQAKKLDITERDAEAEGFPGVKNRAEWFAIDYKGTFRIYRAGDYAFLLTSDDGSKLYIDDELVVDNDGLHAPVTEEGVKSLSAGEHRIRVSYFQGPKGRVALVLKVLWAGE